ncbi:aldo_ket_red domain-containing protein [Haematococcus lacustris]|uniref:Aldo_ket_red domain-containing protein n=1 Tax=Haematococcus lacustris TaxID=44745 RepID=A0A699ZED4_HAELA|nr:aldo_ket_red domain-containing protein [Haematococcus lacustris]
MPAVQAALAVGIRHIDTAEIYKNQEQVMHGIRAAGVPRSELFITSKVLIHWPGASKTAATSPRNAELRLETWRVLEHFHSQGYFRAIGVSNYGVKHLEELLAVAAIPPAVNQVEVHPRWPCAELRAACTAHSVAVVGYASLGCGALLGQACVVDIAQRSGLTPAQGVAVIPKSVRPERIQQYRPDALLADSAQLGAADMERLAQVGLQEAHKYCWDAADIL